MSYSKSNEGGSSWRISTNSTTNNERYQVGPSWRKSTNSTSNNGGLKRMDSSAEAIPCDYRKRMDSTEGIPCDYRQAAPVLPSFDYERKFVTQLVNNNSVVVFSKSGCPYCKDTKSLLSEKGVPYTAVELDKMEKGKVVQNILQEMTSARTVPRIFIAGQCVGGNSDLMSLNANGQLDDILREV